MKIGDWLYAKKKCWRVKQGDVFQCVGVSKTGMYVYKEREGGNGKNIIYKSYCRLATAQEIPVITPKKAVYELW